MSFLYEAVSVACNAIHSYYYSIISKSTSRFNSTQVFLILLFTPPSPTHRDAFRCIFKLKFKFQTFGE